MVLNSERPVNCGFRFQPLLHDMRSIWAPAATTDHTSQNAKGTADRCLIISDDHRMRDALRLIMRGFAWDVTLGPVCNEKPSSCPHLLILDVRKHHSPPLRTLVQMRKSGWNGRAVLISPQPEAANFSASKWRVHAVVGKPFRLGDLKSAIEMTDI